MKTLIAATLKKLGFNRGAPRVYLESMLQAKAGFVPGVRYTVERRGEQRGIRLRLEEEGERIVSKKERPSGPCPVIDLNSTELLSLFDGMEQVRVLIGQGEIWILPLASEVKRQARIERFRSEVAAGEFSTAAIAHGAGVMTNAIHDGLKASGLNPSLRWVIELEEDALEQASEANSAWNSKTVAIAMPMQEVALCDDYIRHRIEPVSLLEAGLPCTAASIAGRSKKKLAQAEDDGKAGHLVVAFLALLARANPAVVVMENVQLWWSSASAAILRTQMREMGYDLTELDLEGADYAIEARVRRVMVGVTKGLDVNIVELVAPERVKQTVGDVLDPIAPDDPRWSAMEYLKEKEVRDIAAGKGFRMAVASVDDTAIGTQGRGYGKCRSTEIKVPHPTDPNLLRLLTPAEHARVKGIPAALIAGVSSATRAHELLGQSVIWPAFRHLGEHVGRALLAAPASIKTAVLDQSPQQSLIPAAA